MQEYPDAKAHYEAYMSSRIDALRAEAEALGLEPNGIINHALAKKVHAEAKADYEEQRAKVLLHNLAEIERQGKEPERRATRLWRLKIQTIVLFACIALCVICFFKHEDFGVFASIPCILLLLGLFLWTYRSHPNVRAEEEGQ